MPLDSGTWRDAIELHEIRHVWRIMTRSYDTKINRIMKMVTTRSFDKNYQFAIVFLAEIWEIYEFF